MNHLLVFWGAFILWLLFVILFVKIEYFFDFGSRIDCPTRNQSYDLRGDIYTIPHRTDFTWLNSGFGSLEPSRCPQRRLMEVETFAM